MGKAEQRQKDSEMAARLQRDSYHKPSAVKARKAARFAAFMANLLKR